MFSMRPPDSHIPNAPKDKWKLLDIHSEEIARQVFLSFPVLTFVLLDLHANIFIFALLLPSPIFHLVLASYFSFLSLNYEKKMTLMEYTLFKAIKPWEYLCWNTKMKQTKSANILAMINKFNVVCQCECEIGVRYERSA